MKKPLFHPFCVLFVCFCVPKNRAEKACIKGKNVLRRKANNLNTHKFDVTLCLPTTLKGKGVSFYKIDTSFYIFKELWNNF
jgi:hypothetical protein